MSPLTVTPGGAASEPVMRPAANLTVGDRIASGFLPHRAAAEIGFVHHHLQAAEPWVFVAYVATTGEPGSDYFRAEAKIPLEGVADFTGLTFSRDTEDDPTPVSPARVPLHTGSVVDGDVLVTDGACE